MPQMAAEHVHSSSHRSRDPDLQRFREIGMQEGRGQEKEPAPAAVVGQSMLRLPGSSRLAPCQHQRNIQVPSCCSQASIRPSAQAGKSKWHGTHFHFSGVWRKPRIVFDLGLASMHGRPLSALCIVDLARVERRSAMHPPHRPAAPPLLRALSLHHRRPVQAASWGPCTVVFHPVSMLCRAQTGADMASSSTAPPAPAADAAVSC
ncbi:hypothetical protein BT67DRAFT_33717 [Trichocladium antarcticum]|uniref:Uncharacterized protein n=1 Tax=Trichocladium antarcticum TaxID=1450529 RepID=A0AAN6ULF3_9PEZI|nr:hypothetical protein BT67DRAFT_33717 [Trichocladium antarcticum]